MSFSDFGRSAMAALSPPAAMPSPTGVSKSRNVRRSSDPLPPRRSGVDETRIDGRRRTKSSRDFDVPKPSVLGSESSRRRRSDGGAIANQRSTSKKNLEIQRGVRPQLNHIQHPVTKKRLMDDVLTVQGDDVCNDASLASTSISSSTTNHDPSYDDDDSSADFSESDIGLNHSDYREEADRRKHRSSNSHRSANYINAKKGARRETDVSSQFSTSPKRRPRRLPKHYKNIPETSDDRGRSSKHTNHRDSKDAEKKQSRSKSASRKNPSNASKLSTEVAQFKKMVADLSAVSKISASSPEAMWKSRILMRSAQDAEQDLKLALEKDEAGADRGKSVAAAALAAARKKLQRDYLRASEQLRSIVEETELRQRAEISTLTASEAAAAGAEGGAQKRALLGAAEKEEDFFERAMRERQAEVQKINDGMKKVQNIYTDLAGLVDGQQEQIDKLEEINEEVKADTRAGLEEIQHGIWKLCVADQHQINGTGKGPHDSPNGATDRQRKKKVLDPSDIFNCMMACQGTSESTGDGRRGVLSLDEELSQAEKKTTVARAQQSKDINVNYYNDNAPASAAEMGWTLNNLEDVQELAQDAFQKGHAIVGGLVGQVQEVVATGELSDVVGNQFSCAPQPEEISLGGYGDDGIGFDKLGTSKGSSVENYAPDEDCKRHRLEEEPRRSRSRHSSGSHSKRRLKQQNRYESEQYEEDYHGYSETPTKKDRHRRKSRHSSSRRV